MHAALVTDVTRLVDDGLVLHHREYGGTLEDCFSSRVAWVGNLHQQIRRLLEGISQS